MPLPPPVSRDQYDVAGRSGVAGFQVEVPPAPSGLGTRQGRIPPYRQATSTRHMMRWLVPEQPIVQMYINPQNLKTNYKKHLSKVRTKGGYTIQYWGEELTTLSISGTTGTSGIEGINVLHDVYRNEQLMFDPYALFLQAQRDKLDQQETLSSGFLGGSLGGVIGGQLGGAIAGALVSASTGGVPNTSRTKPTLASLAFTVELYWSGEVYRGFFESFDVTERADNLGLFEYNIQFTVTQKRGFRQNFLGWHRSATSGPSNSNPITGTPHSFGAKVSPVISGRNRIDQPQLNTPYASGAQSIGKDVIDAFDTF